MNTSAPPPPLTSAVSASVAAFHQVGIVARVPHHPVVSVAAEHLVVAVAAAQRVVAEATEEHVGAAATEQRVVVLVAGQQVAGRPAGQRVVARAAEQLRRRQGPQRLVERDRVGAAQAGDFDEVGVGDRCRPAGDGHRARVDEQGPAGVARDGDVLAGRRAGHLQLELRGKIGCGGHVIDLPSRGAGEMLLPGTIASPGRIA